MLAVVATVFGFLIDGGRSPLVAILAISMSLLLLAGVVFMDMQRLEDERRQLEAAWAAEQYRRQQELSAQMGLLAGATQGRGPLAPIMQQMREVLVDPLDVT